MLKRTIIISSPARVSLANCQLVCANMDDESKISAPVEDLGVVIVENQRTVFTIPALNALADNNTMLVFCDSHMMPNSVLTGLNVNSTYSNVNFGDTDNREGAAARIYWKTLFGKEFSREREGNAPNNMLNYGYAVLRSAVVRALIGSGLNPSFGIFHRNRYNPMPLADDIMEPFRPFVDEIVIDIFRNGETSLTKEIKTRLVNVLSCDTRYGDIRRPLQVGLSMTTASLGKCYLNKEKTLFFPKLE